MHSGDCIIALTDRGVELAEKLQEILNPTPEICYKPKPFSKIVQERFCNGQRLIFICATAIAIRTLAPVLTGKKTDPAVVVLDEQGRFVIPLLSGHEGGANQWAYDIAQLTHGTPVITTATPWLNPVYTIGMGCERGCSESELESLMMDCLSIADISLSSIKSINSIDIKSDEEGLITLADQHAVPFNTWNKEQLATVEEQLSTKSDYVFSVVGVWGVAESAALYGAKKLSGNHAELILNKHTQGKATCAIARAYLN